MGQGLSESQYAAALRAVETDEGTAEEKAEMLMEIGMGMQTKPQTADDLRHAVSLYERALGLCEESAPLLASRIRARMGTALQAVPDGGAESLRRARDCFESALPRLKEQGRPEEVAETELNLGLVMQSLSSSGAARLNDAIHCYHRALLVFTREKYPKEFSILHNNLAVAYLAIPLTDERGRMREALAVQSFEEVLKVITLIDHPSEFAMVQNNLGNALQYASSGHPLENNLRALTAYDEALKVRSARDTPIEYANTIANKANVLRNLPEDPDRLGLGREAALLHARELYAEARELFARFGQSQGVAVVDEAIGEIDQDIAQPQPGQGNGNGRAFAV